MIELPALPSAERPPPTPPACPECRGPLARIAQPHMTAWWWCCSCDQDFVSPEDEPK